MTYPIDAFKKLHAKFLVAAGLDTWRGVLDWRDGQNGLSDAEKFAADDTVHYLQAGARMALANLLKQTQSPIERLFATALTSVLGTRSACVLMAGGDAVWLTHQGGSPVRWTVTPQKPVGAYRADIFLELVDDCHYDNADPDASHVASVTMVVECDGHEFHERTKEQASRDKRRDRFLQEQGHLVFRFSGSDIHRDPFGCALSCVTTMEAVASRSHDAARAARRKT